MDATKLMNAGFFFELSESVRIRPSNLTASQLKVQPRATAKVVALFFMPGKGALSELL